VWFYFDQHYPKVQQALIKISLQIVPIQKSHFQDYNVSNKSELLASELQ